MDKFAQLARGLNEAADERTRLDIAVRHAVAVVGGCDHASVTLADRGRFSTAVATDEVVLRGDRLQYALDEGPCIDAARGREDVSSPDLCSDDRWPAWAPRVRDELGVNSALSLALHTHNRSYGALNLYGDRPHGFSAVDLATARAMAAHLAVALALGREIEQLETALGNRTVIGQAQGILMERLGVDAAQAFAFLRRTSQDHNRKLAHVAEDLVRSRRLPRPAGALEELMVPSEPPVTRPVADSTEPGRLP